MKEQDATPPAPPVLPPGLKDFDQTMRKLVQVPKAELEAEERKYERRKRVRKRRAAG